MSDIPYLILGGGGSLSATGIRTETLLFSQVPRAAVLTVAPALFEGLSQKPGGRSWSPEKNGMWQVTVVYEGAPGDIPDPEAKENFQWLPNRSVENIESHPDIQSLIDEYGGIPGADGKYTWPLKTPKKKADGGGALWNAPAAADDTNPMHGAENYVRKGLSVRWSFVSRSFPYAWVGKDGQVLESIPGGWKTPKGRNWSVSVESIQSRGVGQSLAWEAVIDFHLSEKGGWKPYQVVIDR